MRNTGINTISFSDIGLPRTISFGLKLKIFFGNVLFLIGFIFFLFGSLFVIVFGSNVDFDSIGAFNDTQPTTKGVVVSINETSARENKRDIFRYTTKYWINGKEYTTDSYDSGSSMEVNDTAIVQYSPSDPSTSIIVGMRKAPFSFAVIIVVLIFPLIGLLCGIFGFRKSKEHLRLLRIGLLARGNVLNKYPTNTKINKRTVYEVHFEFKAQNGQMVKSTVKTHQPELVEDEAMEHLVYDAENPEKAVLIDVLPKSVRNFLSIS